MVPRRVYRIPQGDISHPRKWHFVEFVSMSFWRIIPHSVYLYVILADGTPQSVPPSENIPYFGKCYPVEFILNSFSAWYPAACAKTRQKVYQIHRVCLFTLYWNFGKPRLGEWFPAELSTCYLREWYPAECTTSLSLIYLILANDIPYSVSQCHFGEWYPAACIYTSFGYWYSAECTAKSTKSY